MQSEGGGTRTAAAERTDGREIYALAKERETERRTDGARTFDGSFEGSSRLDATMRGGAVAFSERPTRKGIVEFCKECTVSRRRLKEHTLSLQIIYHH